MRTLFLPLFTLSLALWSGGVQALQLTLPATARLTSQEQSAPDSYAFPTGPFADGHLLTATIEGAISRQAWRIGGQGLTTLQLLAPLRSQLEQAGYDITFQCDTDECGGFNFRFNADILTAPVMRVSLSDFRYLDARKGHDERIGLLVSRTTNAGYIQIVQAAPLGRTAPTIQVGRTPSESVTVAPVEKPDGFAIPPELAVKSGLTLGGELQALGHAILSDLTFETGSADLAAGRYDSLTELAAFLLADPNRRIALVGHTDAVGSLSGNITLSKRRATSVLERLAKTHKVPRAQLQAEGMGWLSPLASNLTVEGRDENRRVEAVLLNTQ